MEVAFAAESQSAWVLRAATRGSRARLLLDESPPPSSLSLSLSKLIYQREKRKRVEGEENPQTDG